MQAKGVYEVEADWKPFQRVTGVTNQGANPVEVFVSEDARRQVKKGATLPLATPTDCFIRSILGVPVRILVEYKT